MRWLRATLLFLALLLGPATVLAEAAGSGNAQAVRDVEQLFSEGALLFNRGDYPGALERFNKAFGLIQEPNLLFNIARCHEAMGQVEAAISHYQSYVDHPQATADTRLDAEQRLVRLRRAQAETAARARATPRREAAPMASGALPQGGAEGSARTARAPTGYSPWQWVALGSGAAAVGAGVGMLVLGMKDSSQADDWKRTGRKSDNQPVKATEIEDLRDRAAQKKLIGYLAMGAGGAALATGVVLLVLDWKREKPGESEGKTVALDLFGGPTGAVVGMHGRF
ncbi:MAG: tetratricopeptide repeat protein [Proteobacteria bacterium]|nr:tetratricopeptide repeat protein [Pseudomonadota bacterium]